ncbi:hypothetical protein C8R46DRAFT_1347892 [Mycena filopes]|nr:hypothetical protein C8R46DRAFT_1347892 [Mycena filopes]
MATIPDFHGDRGRDKVCAANFLKKLKTFFRREGVDAADMAARLEEIGDHFPHNSPADRWPKSTITTTPADVATWGAFVAAFIARFQVADPMPKPAAQLEAALSGMRIRMGEVAKVDVLVGGEHVPVLREFAMHVQDAVTAASAGATGGGGRGFVGIPRGATGLDAG